MTTPARHPQSPAGLEAASPGAPAPESSNRPAPSLALGRNLSRLRRRRRRVTLVAGLAQMLALAVALVGVEMTLDFWLDFAWPVRAVLLAGLLAALAFVAARGLLAPGLRRPDDDDLAFFVERRVPSFRGRLIASVQLTRPGALPPDAAASLVRALVTETERLADATDFAALVSTRELKRFGAWAAAAGLAALLALAAGGPDIRTLLARAFLSRADVPRKTRVVVIDPEKRIGRGDSVLIEARGEGILPPSGTLAIKSLVRRGQEFPMERATNSRNRYARALENIQQSFNYQVRLNDGASRTHHVEVLPRPALVSLQCEQVYPDYTGRKPTRRAPGDLVLLAGSRLKLSATASKPLKTASVWLEGPERRQTLSIAPGEPRRLSGEILVPATNLTGFSFNLVDVDGMESRDPAVYHVEILPDKAPVVRILAPDRKEELVTQAATLFAEFQAQDDFQVARAWLRYKVGEAENAATNSLELDLAGAEGESVRRTFPWKIAGVSPPLALGTRLEYWIEVQDNNNVTGPGRGASERQLLRVVTPDEKRADLLARAGDYLGTIGDVAGDQEQLNRNLGTIILEKKR